MLTTIGCISNQCNYPDVLDIKTILDEDWESDLGSANIGSVGIYTTNNTEHAWDTVKTTKEYNFTPYSYININVSVAYGALERDKYYVIGYTDGNNTSRSRVWIENVLPYRNYTFKMSIDDVLGKNKVIVGFMPGRYSHKNFINRVWLTK
jgi:hypothetical protein